MLTPSQVDQYHNDGWLVVPGLIGTSEVERAKEKIARLIDNGEAKGDFAPYYDNGNSETGERRLIRIENFIDADEFKTPSITNFDGVLNE